MTFEWPSWVDPLPFPFPELHKMKKYFQQMTDYILFKTHLNSLKILLMMDIKKFSFEGEDLDIFSMIKWDI